MPEVAEIEKQRLDTQMGKPARPASPDYGPSVPRNKVRSNFQISGDMKSTPSLIPRA